MLKTKLLCVFQSWIVKNDFIRAEYQSMQRIIHLNYLQNHSIADVVLATRYKWKYPIKRRIQKALLL